MQLSDSTLRRILKTTGLTPRRPRIRAARYSADRVERWKSETFPEIAGQARKSGAAIVFADEAGLDSQCVYGRTRGPRGKTPVVRVANARFRLNMLAAISPEGDVSYMVHDGRTTSATFVRFPERIQRETDGKILLIADNASIHKAGIVKKWLAESKSRCEIFYQPTYSPEVNPVELLRSLIKRTVSRQVSRTKARIRANLEAALKSLQETPDKVKALFREKDCAYVLG